MSWNVAASVASEVNTGLASLSTGSDENGLPSVVCVVASVMYLTNFSAASLCLVFLNTDRLIPATWLATCSPPDGAGNGTTPYSPAFMPLATIEESALFWLMTIATFLVAKSLTDLVPLSYCAFDGFATLSFCIRSRYRRTPCTLPSPVKVGLPSLSNQSALFCAALMNAKCTFSV